MPYEHKETRRVEFSDTDMEGIMHYSNFFKFMETAEHGFFRALGLSVVLSRFGYDVCLPRVHAECDYFAPLHFEDQVLIHLLVERKGTRSLTYQFRFLQTNKAVPREVARGRLVVVSAARKDGRSLRAVPLPKAVADQIEEAPRHLLADDVLDGTPSDGRQTVPDRVESAPGQTANS
jgi:YbgC/YbaW family acyl-CoA thioester hydrolase